MSKTWCARGIQNKDYPTHVSVLQIYQQTIHRISDDRDEGEGENNPHRPVRVRRVNITT